MTQILIAQFRQALEKCQSLREEKYHPSTKPCEAIELLAEVSQKPLLLINLLKEYSQEVENACQIIDEYARNADNWRVKGEACSLGFGVKDHCSILSFLLNLDSQKFNYYTGNLDTKIICEFLKDWKGIDLSSYLSKPISIIN